ncbi:MAG: UvrD-helicase domain-containing protein [Acidobacteriota bacterium]
MTKPHKAALADQAARDRIRNDFDTTLVVEAAAGTGKTSELVGRIVAGIKSGRVKLNKIVAVTFTDAAAGELKLRLRDAIEQHRQDPQCPAEARELLKDSLPQLEEARIGTIHSFCADLLRERPVEAGIDPLFDVAPEDTARPLFELAFDRWFEQQLANPGEAVRRILRRRPRREYRRDLPGILARRPRDAGPKRALRGAARELIERRDFPAQWRRNPEFDLEAAIDGLIAEMTSLAQWADSGSANDYFLKSLKEIKVFIEEVNRVEEVAGRDYDGLEATLTEMNRGKHWKWVGYASSKISYPRDELIARRNAVKESLQGFVDQAGADLAPRLRDELWPVIEEYERLKERAGCLDFLDLLLRSRDLVKENASVRAELQQRFTYIFVDEFQDTDPLQAELLMLLSADDPNEKDWRRVRPVAGKLFIVGDPKQSIYRFRRADVALYEQVKRQIKTTGGDLLELNVSFRSVPAIQQAVNAAFSRVMGATPSPAPGAGLKAGSTQARYVPLAPHRSGVDSQPAIVALPVPAPYGDYGKVVEWKIEESLPGAVAAFVDWLVRESGWTITEREHPDVQVPIRPRHVCLLFRRFRSFMTDVTRPYVRALEARRLPHLLVGGSSFHSREEVEAIRNALAAIERPDDELALFATLKGPLFAISDAQLLAYRSRFATLHPFKQVPEDLPESLVEVVDALAVLRELHLGRNRRPVADTIGRLLATTRAHAGFANWATGEQALANVTRLMDMARRAEQGGLISFRAFVDWLDDQAENGEAGDAPIIEEGAEGVRIMTVHKAKGLEFPVVVLADMTAKEAREPSRWTDTEAGLCVMRLAGCLPPELQEHAGDELQLEREEAARVLYVAATRARDLLVVTAVGDERREGWLSVLDPAIYPPAKESFKPETNHPPGCPEFGADNVAFRPKNGLRKPGSVTPGLHKPEAGEHSVAWWDPSVLELNRQDEIGARLNKLLAADEEGKRSEQGIRDHSEWQENRTRVRDRASAPSVRVVTATEHAKGEEQRAKSEEQNAAAMSHTPVQADPPVGQLDLFAAPPPPSSRSGVTVDSGAIPDVAVESAGIDFSRPHGKRFGTLVHAVLSLVDLNADAAGVQAAAELQGRLLGAGAEEINAAKETVTRALAHPLLRRAAAASLAGRCRRESPIAIKLEDGMLVEGIVDLAFIDETDPGMWIVVDFKTDFEIGGRLEEYREQIALYSEAIARATKQRATGVLLRL